MNIQILDLAKKVAEGLGKPFEYDWYGDPDRRSYRVSFDKINKTLGYNTEFTFEMSALEIWKALEGGIISWQDPKTRTVNWYKTLLEWNKNLKKIGRHGEIL
ncbi:hypothetical protein SDC9_182418 [bioreactor metagenome]|uniref:Uncharacterized protein n=1 Tax=bioreactor metagenome TaxID=1076179 RepID=A0A645HFP4_9ZZZZ